MDLMAEMEKLTEPTIRNSSVRRLTVDEIVLLRADSQITPLDQVLTRHICGVEHMPVCLGRGSYVY